LTHLHEPAVVHCLRNRYKKDVIYTATGPVLLALNPFKACRGLYSETCMKRYWERAEKIASSANNAKQASSSTEQLPPHVYGIADDAFRTMMRHLEDVRGGSADAKRCDQSILVSGESGAGKTVTTKFIMKYLAALSQRKRSETPTKKKKPRTPTRPGKSPRLASASAPSWASPATVSEVQATNTIESQVLQSNPILESFGNARTVRNDNSSRFGKFIEIQFTSTGSLVGANIETYLLEKVRLISQSVGERNYHIFYEMLNGMSQDELQQFHLEQSSVRDYKMTGQSGTFDRRDGIPDRDTFAALRVAMDTMGFSPEEQGNIFCVASSLLHASNLTFVELDDMDESSIDFSNPNLGPFCNLLGVTPEDLNSAICYFSIQAGREGSVRRSLSKEKAEKGMEALIKAAYGALFGYLVQRINDSIAYKKPELDEENSTTSQEGPAAYIGVLDIFGFESFAINSFEQLCINYCNEALQQQFNAFVLKNEQEEYEREGIEWSFITFPENQDVLDLIDKRGIGILNILDDQCRAPGTTDRSFASDVYAKCTQHPRFSSSHRQVSTRMFEVQHYAGSVEYTMDGFVVKNRDELPKETTELLLGSENSFVHYLAEIITQNSGRTSPPTTEGYKRRTDSSVNRITVGGQFRRRLRDLRAKIDLTSPHYIRCLKPNDKLVPDLFDPVVIAEQLRCGGILEAVRVSRAGYTQHYPHLDFVRRYKILALDELRRKENFRAWNGGLSPIAGSPRRGSTNTSSSREECDELVKILYRKIREFEEEEKQAPVVEPPKPVTMEPVRAKSYSAAKPVWSSHSKTATLTVSKWQAKTNGLSHLNVSTPRASSVRKWPTPGVCTPNQKSSVILHTPRPGKGTSYSGTNVIKSTVKAHRNSTRSSSILTSPNQVPSSTKGPTGTELGKVGIQMGKTKVFLRNKAFETLERIRIRKHVVAATTINSVMRMFLARKAYLVIRNAHRAEMRAESERRTQLRSGFETHHEVTDRRGGEPIRHSERNSSVNQLAVKYNDHRIKRFEQTATSFQWILVDKRWVKSNSHM